MNQPAAKPMSNVLMHTLNSIRGETLRFPVIFLHVCPSILAYIVKSYNSLRSDANTIMDTILI